LALKGGDMKKETVDLLGGVFLAAGLFLIFYLAVDWFFARINFVASPQLCLITGSALVGVGFVIQASSKKK